MSVDAGEARTLLLVDDVTELMNAQRARSELVANVSHELRTPLAAARALAETLATGVDEAGERERFLARLVEELERLGAIVQRLLWLARLESGAEPFDTETLDTHALLDEAASRIAPVGEQRHVHLEAAADADAGLVLADRERVLEVLSNLLDNAVRFSPEGETVRMNASPDGGFVRFEVSDHGPGILPRDRERVFERFYTGDRSRESGAGTGLGLAIARRIVQRLGGRIWVADRTEPGASICFTLPSAPPGDEVAPTSDGRVSP
jgi:signal transduction histidine kinase